jgi:flagellar basal-body rod protein FlgG
MLAEDAAQQVIAQNLANVSTTGYKEEIPIFQSFQENLVAASDEQGGAPLGTLGSGSSLTGTFTDFSDGPLQQTGNNLDIALRGNAYFSVQTPNGIMFSRDGALALGSTGILVQAASGNPVLDSAGRTISIAGKARQISIDPDGNVDVDGITAGTIGLFSITAADNPAKMGGNLITIADKPTLLDPSSLTLPPVMSGYLEGSNVNIVKEMVTMIACTRAYEANAKTLQAHDETLSKAVSDVGKLA